MLCVVNAHQSLAVENFGGFKGKEKKGAPDVRVQIVRKVLQTGVVVPIYALSDEQHAYGRLIFSPLVPLA
jgi:hypothetical protein